MRQHKLSKYNNTADDDIGKHIIVGLCQHELLPEERGLLSTLRPIGIVLFKRNIAPDGDWPQKLKNLIFEAKECTKRSRFFVSIDHEGGRVHRMRQPITHFAPASEWGENAFNVGRTMGQELRELGINLNFAPVLDTLTEPKNTVIGNRAISSDPLCVAQKACQFIEGLEGQAVLACGKHFPGHGGTIKDSHLELPIRDITKEELKNTELIPFVALIEKNIHMLMTAHVFYPEIDNNYPGTLSSTILNEILRHELNYANVIISDALEMNALSNISTRDIVVQAFKSSIDILLIAEPKSRIPLEYAKEIITETQKAIEQGLITKATLIESKHRIDNVFEYLESLSSH